MIPKLFAHFELAGRSNVYCAEDLSGVLQSNSMTGEGFTISKRLHENEPPSLAHKTPLLANHFLPDWKGFDLLIDDSVETRNSFSKYGLSQHLISIDGKAHPCSDLLYVVKDVIDDRLNNKHCDYHQIVRPTKVLTTSVVRILDPTYLPTLRRTLEL